MFVSVYRTLHMKNKTDHYILKIHSVSGCANNWHTYECPSEKKIVSDKGQKLNSCFQQRMDYKKKRHFFFLKLCEILYL